MKGDIPSARENALWNKPNLVCASTSRARQLKLRVKMLLLRQVPYEKGMR